VITSESYHHRHIRHPITGVAGQALSGGFSWKTNEHGLTIDTTVSYEIVLPDASYRTVTVTSDPDLFFALQVSSDPMINQIVYDTSRAVSTILAS
jgi:hypothetical protein